MFGQFSPGTYSGADGSVVHGEYEPPTRRRKPIWFCPSCELPPLRLVGGTGRTWR